jgi:drug/metabolite transporter (DMT)-like permease
VTVPLRGALITVAAGCFFGTVTTLVKLFYEAGGEPFAIIAIRFIGGAVILGAILLAFGRPVPPRRIALACMGLGVVQLGTGAAVFEGLARAPAALVIVIFYVFPLLVVVGAALFLGERLTARRAVIVLVGFSGVALAVGTPSSVSGIGVLLGLAAAVCSTTHILIGRRLLTGGLSAVQLNSFMQFGAASVVLVVVAARGVDLSFGAEAWGWALASLLVGTVLASLLFFTGVKLVGAGTASLLVTIEPVIGICLAYAVLGESLHPAQLVGGALVIGAVVALSGPTARAAWTARARAQEA